MQIMYHSFVRKHIFIRYPLGSHSSFPYSVLAMLYFGMLSLISVNGFQIPQVCGYIHIIDRRYVAALDSYVKEADEPIHLFCYVNKMLSQLSGDEFTAFQSAIISRIPELLDLSR